MFGTYILMYARVDAFRLDVSLDSLILRTYYDHDDVLEQINCSKRRISEKQMSKNLFIRTINWRLLEYSGNEIHRTHWSRVRDFCLPRNWR